MVAPFAVTEPWPVWAPAIPPALSPQSAAPPPSIPPYADPQQLAWALRRLQQLLAADDRLFRQAVAFVSADQTTFLLFLDVLLEGLQCRWHAFESARWRSEDPAALAQTMAASITPEERCLHRLVIRVIRRLLRLLANDDDRRHPKTANGPNAADTDTEHGSASSTQEEPLSEAAHDEADPAALWPLSRLLATVAAFAPLYPRAIEAVVADALVAAAPRLLRSYADAWDLLVQATLTTPLPKPDAVADGVDADLAFLLRGIDVMLALADADASDSFIASFRALSDLQPFLIKTYDLLTARQTLASSSASDHQAMLFAKLRILHLYGRLLFWHLAPGQSWSREQDATDDPTVFVLPVAVPDDIDGFYAFLMESLSHTDSPAAPQHALRETRLVADFETCFPLRHRIRQWATTAHTIRLKFAADSLEQCLVNVDDRHVCADLAALGGAAAADSPDPAAAAAIAAPSSEATWETLQQSDAIQQIRDMFPDLAADHVARLLVYYKNDREAVVASYLEGNLPPVDLLPPAPAPAPAPKRTAPPSTPSTASPRFKVLPVKPKSARNKPEADASVAAFSKSIPKAPGTLRIFATNQLSVAERERVLGFDADAVYEDEYDDTFDDEPPMGLHADEGADVEGVAGAKLKAASKGPASSPSASAAAADAPPDPTRAFEQPLVEAWDRDPAFFQRPSRANPERLALVQASGLTHEQIEGWGRQMDRMPPPARNRLLAKYAWRGNRPLQRSNEGDDSGDSDGASAQDADEPAELRSSNSPRNGGGGSDRGRGGRRGVSSPRGRGRGGGGQGGGRGGDANSRGGHTSGDGAAEAPSGEPGAPLSRDQQRRKNAQKARVGNHSRKRGHDRKLARGMGGGFP
ncbi:hypothetical protein CXG81DRAFT_27252 [Caulochytrium protostelioides]|uniref:CUE domain-containing protein n=1 Tax=Caulochytrium protostelioides TaxID=1555241 RepID=A0A4P9X4K1_9FUNG|nr:hypothetical protein CXG81DRAFT_27252 [Caulochytrium protostelioides]|eukprot:RKP00007.1 hypothetical protein CXG81DRAFT_27252 [Caulochytrium protostelioides]